MSLNTVDYRILILAIVVLFPFRIFSQSISVNWDKTLLINKTTPTLQIVENPKIRPSSPIYNKVFQALENLEADYVRYVPWFPYPKLAVAELEPPTPENTSWNFKYLDSSITEFMNRTKGHPVVMNISTTPAWMWEGKRVNYPDDPYQVYWSYNQGEKLRDTTLNEISNYYERVFKWYTQGGFTDENGRYHKSGYYYEFDFWEVLNEPDLEHKISPQLYCKIYDAIVLKLQKISPRTKFVGISTAHISNPDYFEYFLNPVNHKEGVPLDAISYHHYSIPSYLNQDLKDFQYTAFEKAESFLNQVNYIENIRKRLAPSTISMLNEIGIILRAPGEKGPIPNEYWNLAASVYAHMFIELSRKEIEVVGQSQLVGYPGQFPDVSMLDWKNGNPNSRYWVLKLLINNFRPGDKLVKTDFKGRIFIGNHPDINAQGFDTKNGKKILFVNKRNKIIEVKLSEEVNNAKLWSIDTEFPEYPKHPQIINGNKLSLKPFAVAVLDL